MIQLILPLLVIIGQPGVPDHSRWGVVKSGGATSGDYDLAGEKLYGHEDSDPNTYFWRSGADEWTLVAGGQNIAVCDTSYCTFLGLSSDSAPVFDGINLSMGEIDSPGNDIFDPVATDSAPADRVITTQQVYPGVNATNKTGSTLYLAGGTGAINLTGVTKAGTAGDTITFVINKYATPGTNTSVTFTEGVTYTCAAAADDSTCVCNLYTAVLANATLAEFVNVVRTNATCSDEKLFFGLVKDKSVHLTVTPSDSTNTAITSSTSGNVVGLGTIEAKTQILGPMGSAATPSIAVTSAGGMYRGGANILRWSTSGAYKMELNDSGNLTTVGAMYSGGDVLATSAYRIGWLSSTSFTSSSDGLIVLQNAAQNKGVTLSVNAADNVLYLMNRGGTGGGALYLNTIQSQGSGYPLEISIAARSTAGAGQPVNIYGGANTYAGDVAGGAVNIVGGATTTDGLSGGVNIAAGVAGAGIADSGDVIVSVNGAPGTGTTMFRTVASTLQTLFSSLTTSVPQTISCADTGDGNASACGGAQALTSNVVIVNCLDEHGCTLSLTETGLSATVGANVILHAGATQTGQLTLSDSAGVVELSAAWTPAAIDTLCLSYSPELYWAECGRSDNSP